MTALVQGDAVRLPFADAAFDTVIACWLSTDVDDLAAVVREVARVLRPQGQFVHVSAHPCFTGPHTEALPDDSRLVHPTYRVEGLHEPAPWWRPGGIRSRIPLHHRSLSTLLACFCDNGLLLREATEPGDSAVPWTLGLRFSRPGYELASPGDPRS
ncbi:methyltransferase domain-containing protein [Kineococcus sp. R8]|uniref:class I SAM-dependent methyltransferase n=1 Tax=Kineococcus siccus TaxID=2696567 RepID=UPI00141268E8|nr:class I SAM-dependent methyltransferase [Kineococcus siccus]NAZ83019.1 methyltransferase domain-containing protein [Kineococcus siccus]